MYPFASLPANLAAFCDVLRREHGFRIGPGELADAARALDVVPLAREASVRDGLRAVLSGSAEDVRVFDQAFDEFFLAGAQGVPQDGLPRAALQEPFAEETAGEHRSASHRSGGSEGAEDPSEEGESRTGEPAEEADDSTEAAAVARSRWSPMAAQGDAPVLHSPDEVWSRGARALVRRFHVGRSRRWRSAPRGSRFDLRRTLRASLHTGGEALVPRWLTRPKRSPRFVVLIDGSRSMSAYAGVAMQIAVALASVTSKVDVFVFSTGLRRVTADIRDAAAGGAHRLSDLRDAWGGGTTIGACLREFVTTAGERLLGPDTVIVIASDGLDVGEPEVIRHAMCDVRRASAAVIWLNPLIATPGYEPTALGMRVARPYVTTFASVANHRDFAKLARTVRLDR